MADLFDRLNEKQKEAVLETEGYVRVIAGAGSGKTKLLVSRYAYLVQEYGIDSANILCVTFTNKAAGEMKKRIRALIGEEHGASLVCTYHGFCSRLLRENPEKLFLNKQFQIIDSHQQKAVLGEIYQGLELKLDYASFESILRKIGRVKKDTRYVARLCSPDPCQILDEIKDQDDHIIEQFLQRQKATYSLDFHDLICFAIYLLETDTDILEKWQDRLNYIMVDEFQDSSSTEMRLIDLLSGRFENLMIVGDPDQNIYEWRGSDVKLLVDFDKNHADTKTIFLSQNYRSTPQILQCANTLIEKNKLRLKKDLFTQNAAGAPVIHYHSKNDFEEMDRVIENIKMLSAREGFKYSDFAIIYRSGFLSRIAEKKLVEKNIPYMIFGGVRFYQRMEILDILAYLKLIAYDDDVSFRRIVNTPRRRFGRAKMNALEQIKERSSQTYFTALSSHLEEKDFVKSDAASFVQFIEHMRNSYQSKRIPEIINEVTAGSGYEKYIRELGDEERLDNLAEFKRIANEFEREFGEHLTLEEFLQQIALQSGEDQEESKDTVKLMTIHSSKGLEFPVVFILGFTEGIFPSSKTLGDRRQLGLEEERRLCYVAITRAQRHLFLMESEGVSQNGIKKLVSRFLDEIGENNYIRIGSIPEDLQQESRGYAAKHTYESDAPKTESKAKKIGDVVEHHVFGKGTIQSIDEKRSSYSVLFEKLKQPRTISSSYFMKEHKSEPRKNTANSDFIQLDLPADHALNTYPQKGSCCTSSSSQPSIPVDQPSDLGIIKKESDLDLQPAIDTSTNILHDDNAPALEPSQDLKKLKDNSPNLWKHEEVPHSGWSCVNIEDLGAPVGICEMCGHQIIRYAHHMKHPKYHMLSVGCICAGKMEGNIESARQREADFKNKQARRMNFLKRTWKRSKKGNEYLKINGHIAVLYKDTKWKNAWKYSIDNNFDTNTYPTREAAVLGLFDALEQLKADQ